MFSGGNFKELGAHFLFIAAFALETITLIWYLSDTGLCEKLTIPFAQEAKWVKSQGCSCTRLLRARNKAVGPRRLPCPSHTCWRSPCRAPALPTAVDPSNTIHADCTSLYAPPVESARLLRASGSPQCFFPWSCACVWPAAGSRSVNFHFFFFFGKTKPSLSKHHTDKMILCNWQFGYLSWYFALVILSLMCSLCKDR